MFLLINIRGYRTRLAGVLSSVLTIGALGLANAQKPPPAEPDRVIGQVSVSPLSNGVSLLTGLRIGAGTYGYASVRQGYGAVQAGTSFDLGLGFDNGRGQLGWFTRIGTRFRREPTDTSGQSPWHLRLVTDIGVQFCTRGVCPFVAFPAVWAEPWSESVDMVVGLKLGFR